MISRMLMFTLAISCLTTSNLSWFMDLTFQVPMQYCSLHHRTLLLSPVPSNWVLLLLWLHPFILSGVISPLISSNISGTYWPEEFIFQCPIFLPFHTVHGVVKARILKWFAIPFSSGPYSARPLHHDVHLGWPHTSWLNVIELDKAVVHVIRLASCLWLWFQSVCPLMPSLSTYRLTWVSLTLDVGYLFMAASAKCSRCSLPWTWGSSSQPLPLTSWPLGLQWDPTSPSKRKSVLGVHWKDWCWSWNSNVLAPWCDELTHLKRPWCLERLKPGGEGDDRGWDG